MFEENFNFEGSIKEDVEKFEAFLSGEDMGFLDADRWEALIDHYVLNGQYNKATICAKEALSQFSYNNNFKLRLAQCYTAMGKLKSSLNLINELELEGVTGLEITLSKASVFSQLKDNNNAIKYFMKALDFAEKTDAEEIYLDIAMEYENKRDFETSINFLDKVLAFNPSHEIAIYEKAYCFEQMNQYENAIQCYESFIDENPYSYTGWYNLGNAFIKVNNFDKAIWAYDYCNIINPEFGPAYFNLAHAYLSQEKFVRAIEYFEKSTEIDGDDALAYCYIGECHEQLGELELAKHFYKRSLDLMPEFAEAWLGLGIVKDLEGNTKEGITLIQKALELDADNANIYHVLAGAYEKIENDEKASEYYLLALGLDPSDEECLVNYINHISKTSWIEAKEFLTVFEKSNGESEIVNLLRVNVLIHLGSVSEAINLYKTCLNSNREKAKEIFNLNPDLKNIQELVLLSDN